MGASCAGEIPLLSSFLYLFDGAEAGRRPSPGSFAPRLLVLEGRLCSSHSLVCESGRSASETVSGGEFGWGGTSVKR